MIPAWKHLRCGDSQIFPWEVAFIPPHIGLCFFFLKLSCRISEFLKRGTHPPETGKVAFGKTLSHYKKKRFFFAFCTLLWRLQPYKEHLKCDAVVRYNSVTKLRDFFLFPSLSFLKTQTGNWVCISCLKEGCSKKEKQVGLLNSSISDSHSKRCN